jgi:DNA-binding NtrC family response regulator
MTGRVCVVDHDCSSRDFIRECLEKAGHHVAILDNGFQIRPVLSSETFNVFILNIDTPGVREKNLLLDIRRMSSSRILLTVSARGDAFLKEAIDLGVYGFIYKPFDPQEVCTMVNHLTR